MSSDPRVPTIYLDHGEAYGNLGDEAMLLNAVRRIRRRLGECRFVVPCETGRPLPTIEGGHHVTAPRLPTAALAERSSSCRRALKAVGRRVPSDLPWRVPAWLYLRGVGLPGWRRVLGALARCDAVYCVGAANMNDVTRRSQLLVKWLIVSRARRLGIPAVVSSQALGPLTHAWALRKALETARRASHFSLRDRGISRELLVTEGLDVPRVGDEAFSLPAAPESGAFDLLARAGVDGRRPFGFVHFRATDYVRPTQDCYALLAALFDGLRSDAQVVFLPMSYGHRSSPDVECAAGIRALMAKPTRLQVLDCPSEPGVARRLVGMARWVVSLSYHLQVFALAEGTPVLPLVRGAYYRAKARGLLGWTDGRLPAASLDEVSECELQNLTERLEEQADNYASILGGAARRIARVNDAPVEALAQALGR